MPCYSPLRGYRSTRKNETGKRGIVFNRSEGFSDMQVVVPCGQCIGCRLERSRQWAVRCVHEAKTYKENCFITLTYSEEEVPRDFGLRKADFQKFMKRLRKRYPGKTIRYYHCGEYGEKNLRPHYHACLFNHDFRDKALWSVRSGIRLYTSETLSVLWPMGFSIIGDVNFQSAAYIARYVVKKQTGKNSQKHYERVDQNTGEVFNVIPEYTTMSLKPAIGKGFLEKYGDEIYRDDFIIINGSKQKPPKYYDRVWEVNHPDIYERIRQERRKNNKKHEWNQTGSRLKVRKKVKEASISHLKRGIEQ